MKNLICIISGEPNSINSEIIGKVLKMKKKFIRQNFFIIGNYKLIKKQFKQLKSAFENCVGSWIWIEYAQNELNQSSSRIEKEIQNVNIFDKNTWSVIFHFFEENLIKFDAFWIDFKDLFKQLDD